ncbi:MAG: STT3 domain-containing protein, partial [archaeon]
MKGFVSKVDKKELFFVFLLFLLAFGVRAHMMRFDLMWEFDTYFHARIAGEVIQNNFAVPQFDPMAYYFMENSVPNTAVFFWLLSAAIYKIFTLGAPYDKELWIVFVKALPAVFGALTSIAMYYLGKELYGRKAGYAMAFFAATVPAFVYRTMAGQFEGQSLGFLWLVIGFIFLVRAVKHLDFNKTSIRNAILAGIFFGIMAWSWAAFLIIPLILIGYFFSSLIVFWFKNTPFEKILNFAKIVVISSLVFSFLATLFVGTTWIDSTISSIAKYVPLSQQNISSSTDIGGDNVLAATVGEENTGKQFFGEKYSALIIFPILALILIPLNLIRKKDYATSLLIFAWTLLALYMAW